MISHLIRTMPSSGRRLAGIEGLRALAASSVLVYHAWLYSEPNGVPVGLDTPASVPFESLSLGVTLFFVLSGFLLYRPFAAAALEHRGSLSVSAYFRNRALRILPAYWVILVITGLVLQSTLVRERGELDGGGLTDPLDFASSAFFVQGYRPGTVVTGIGPAWSLAVEAVFYLVLPLLGALALALATRSRTDRQRSLALVAPAGLLLVVGLAGKLAAATLVQGTGPGGGWNADWHSVLVRSFLAQADLFSFGMVVAVLHIELKRRALRLPSGWQVVAIAVAAPIAAVSAIRLASVDGQFSYMPENTLIAAAFAVLVAIAVLPGLEGGPSRLSRMLEAPVAVTVGLISYSVFLWHEPLVRWLTDHGLTAAGPAGLAMNIAVLAAVTGVLSMLTYRFVEVPALRHKRSMRVRPAPKPAAKLASAREMGRLGEQEASP
jgi:peptidoglycan/LPS O-acetylase OafA/YrhL